MLAAMILAAAVAGTPPASLDEAIARVAEQQHVVASRARLDWRWYALPILAHGLDAGSTVYGLSRSGLHEANAGLYGSHPTTRRVLTTKAAEAAAHIAIIHLLARTGHPRAAKVFSCVSIAPASYGAWNISLVLR